MNIIEKALSISGEIIKWRRELHRFPETGLILPKTSAYVKERLDEMGIDYQTYEGHSGIVALIGKKEGKVVAIRADMDGLLIKEESGVEYSSENDNMHACGHDAHTAMLLGAAKLFKEQEDQLEGKIKLLFQPAEEGPGGALPMVLDGVLENPKVDYILAQHVENLTGVNHKNGHIVVSYAHTMAADEQFYIKITGKGGHGSTPEACLDPVAIAALAINNIQYIISREIKPSLPSVITFASLEAGRGTYNIIPDYAELKGTIRTVDLETRDFIFKRMREILTGLVHGMRAEFELEFLDGYPPLINDGEVVTRFVNSAKKIIPEGDIHNLEAPLMGGEDAAFFFEKIPGCYFFLLTEEAFEGDGKVYAPHNSKFRLDDSVLYKGTALFVQAATDLLQNTH